MNVYTSCPDWVVIMEDTDSVRSPGWYTGWCSACGAETSGSEPVVEEWADEHAECGLRTALETLPIRRGTARRLGIRRPAIYATGGIIHGPRDPDDDTVEVFISPGCAYLPPDVVEHYRPELLAALNGKST
jgi:hypothetical protein